MQKRISPGDDLSNALLVFAVFAWELLVLVAVDPLLASGTGRAAGIWHHMITAAGWIGGGAYLGVRGARAALFTGHRAPTSSLALRTPIVVIALVLAVGVRALFAGELKITGEITGLVAHYGAEAVWAGLALFFYYAAETLLLVLLILFAQRAGVGRFGRAAIPWGGIVLALTWGVMHFFLQGPSAGGYAMIAAVLYGVVVVYGPMSRWCAGLLVGVAFVV